MASSEKSRKPKSEQAVAAGTSRVSKVVGGVGAQSLIQVEQRSGSSSTRQSSRSSSASSKRSSAGGKSASKKSSASPRRSAAAPAPQPTGDVRFMSWAREKWASMEPHEQQRFYSIMLLVLSLLLLASLTIFRKMPIFTGISGFFMTFFGWSAYLIGIGLFAFAVAHLVEAIRNQQIVRWSFVLGIIVLWLIVLTESQLIFGGLTGGVLGKLLATPFIGWSPASGHVLLIGLFIIVSILTFRITFGHVLLVARFLQRIMSTDGAEPAIAKSNGRTRAMEGPSPYRGQRPRYSRYGGNSDGMVLPPPADEEEYEDDEDDDIHDDKTLVDFHPDLMYDDDDPLNDINIHKQHISRVPRGPSRPPKPVDPHEYREAIDGAQQQALPFKQAAQIEPPMQAPVPVENAVKAHKEMEPLAPNPRKKPPKTPAKMPEVPASIAGYESAWNIPDTSLLNRPEEVKLQMIGDDTATLAKTIQDTLRSFRVDAEVRPEDISIGPTIIRFGIRPTGKPEMRQDAASGKMVPVRDASGNIVYETRTRVSRIMALQNDLALVLEAKTIRMEAPVPGRPYVGVEIPNKNSRLVTLREVLESKEYQVAKGKSKLAIGLGKDVAGQVRVGDLAKMPHVLIAGATGAGKSVCINTIIASFLTQASPDDVRLLMVDPKMVELSMYNGIPHLLAPVVTEVEKVVPLLKNAITEMERRYRLFSQLSVRNLDGYRKLRAEKMAKGDNSLKNLPAIVIIIDELADLMMAAPEEVEGMICRLAQLARATGIHLVVATQRPSVDVITGLIKANIPTRISFMVSSAIDSRTIIDMGGAERLLGRGDMLYLPADAGRPERIQCCFLTDEEASTLVEYWKEQAALHAAANSASAGAAAQPAVEPGWEIKEQPSDDFELEDDLLDKAEEVVREYEKASISLLQRRLRIGYSRAARLIDLLEERGIIGRSDGNGRSREVLDSSPSGGRRGGGEGRTMADEVADIIAEEKAREEALKKAAANKMPTPPRTPTPIPIEDDEPEGDDDYADLDDE